MSLQTTWEREKDGRKCFLHDIFCIPSKEYGEQEEETKRLGTVYDNMILVWSLKNIFNLYFWEIIKFKKIKKIIKKLEF